MEGPAVLGALKIVRASLELNHRLIPNGLFCSLMVMKKCGLTPAPATSPTPQEPLAASGFSQCLVSRSGFLPVCVLPTHPAAGSFKEVLFFPTRDE